MKISTLIFDFGGVLINLDRDACVRQYQQLGVANADKLLDNYMQSGVFLALEKGEISLEEFHKEIRRISNQNLSDQVIDDAFRAFLLDIPKNKMDKIAQLHQQYRTLILSNTNELHFPIKSNKLVNSDYIIDDYFDHCYLSFQMHLSKPDEKIFKSLLENEHIKPQECLYLDDGEKNIETALHLGFNCYWVKDGKWVDEIDEILKQYNNYL